MSHWIITDGEKLEGFYTKKNTRPESLKLDLGLEPMGQEEFDYIIVDFLKHIGPSVNEFLVASYTPQREDNITCIQAARNSDGTYYIEILTNLNEKDIPFHVYVNNKVSFQETVRFFKMVLVYFECPLLKFWEDDTENQLRQMREQKGGIY